jgi:hypothetical protein
MPLDSTRKANHIAAVTARSFTGRTQNVVFVYDSAGSYSYVATSVIWRAQTIIDPQLPNAAGGKPGIPFDVLIIAPLATNFTGVVYIAYTTTATQSAVQAAQKYEVIEALPIGIVPGGTHIRALLRRLR